MTKRVSVEELGAEVQEHVRHGETIVVIDGEQTVATIAPSSLTVIRHDPAKQLRDFVPGPRPKRLDFDAADWLIEERDRERTGKKYSA